MEVPPTTTQISSEDTCVKITLAKGLDRGSKRLYTYKVINGGNPMTDKEIETFFYDSEIYQSSVDALVDQLHELVSQGNISDAKLVADRIRELQAVG